jgi:hypothetical protein
MQALFFLFSAELCDFHKFRADIIIALGSMGQKTGRAILDAVVQIAEITPTVFPKGIEGAVAEEAVKILPVTAVTGEVFAVLVLKIFIAHSASPILSPKCTLVSMPLAE